MNTTYRFMRRGEEERVCALVGRVFNEFVAPDYSPEGVEEFFKFAAPAALRNRDGDTHIVLLAEEKTELAGVLEARDCKHISLLFVEKGFHRKGIAKELLRLAIRECRKRLPDLRSVTVNSSPFAIPAYRKMGFLETGPSREVNGIIFVPMVCALDELLPSLPTSP